MSDPLELEHESDFRTENVNMANTQFATDEIKIKKEDTGMFGADLLMNQAKKKERPRSPSRESNRSNRFIFRNFGFGPTIINTYFFFGKFIF